MADVSYNIPDLRPGEVFRVEQTIKRSRFIASVGHTPGVEEAKAFIEQIKAEFEDARHNCWAYCAGAAGSTDRIGASDDGEPHGTAGRPMLTAVTHSGIGEVTVVVTRYFGGILLGTGGLVKAYQSSVKMALEGVPTRVRTKTKRIKFSVEHRFVNQVLRKIEAGVIDTTISLWAVTGMAGFGDAINAVMNRTSGGKIMVFPMMHDLGLTPVSELAEKLPTVAAKLDAAGLWTKEAEEALLATR